MGCIGLSQYLCVEVGLSLCMRITYTNLYINASTCMLRKIILTSLNILLNMNHHQLFECISVCVSVCVSVFVEQEEEEKEKEKGGRGERERKRQNLHIHTGTQQYLYLNVVL